MNSSEIAAKAQFVTSLASTAGDAKKTCFVGGLFSKCLVHCSLQKIVLKNVSEFQWKFISGIYPDLLHICDLALYTDMYGSAFMVYTADRSIIADASRDLRLRSLHKIYLKWCVQNRVLVYKHLHICKCTCVFIYIY